MTASVLDRIEELDDLKTRFGGAAHRRKAALLHRLSRAEIPDPGELLSYHETLCFLRAFPDSLALLRAADGELRRFVRRVDLCREAHGGEIPESLVDTGVAGSPFHYPYGFPMVCWLVDRFADAADIDWEEYEERCEDLLSPVILPLVGWVETAALDDELLSIREWFEAARGRKRIGLLRWLVGRLRRSGIPEEVQETLFDGMELSVRWELGGGAGSRTLARAPAGRLFFHTGAMRGRTADLRAEIARPLPRVRPAGKGAARAWLDLVRCALSVRSRELYPIALASEEEVYVCDVGRGVRIALYGMRPDRRLPIESDYGAFIVKNGMPIGYGVGALLLDRMEIAVNIFPAFRQGESSFVFEQFNRLFHHQFGCNVFLVERYQLGHENDEGLDAGSFWFYYKLGFRSLDPKAALLAEEEADRLKREPGARTPRRMLRRLARSHVLLSLKEGGLQERCEISLTRIGLAVSRLVEERFAGDRARAEQVCSREAARLLGIGDLSRWSEGERTAFARLSPLIRILPGLTDWKRSEKQALARAVRCKGRAQEADYARGMARPHPIRPALETLSRADSRPAGSPDRD